MKNIFTWKKQKSFKNKLIYLLVFCSTSLWAQEPTQVNSIFWEISGNDLAKPSYLFGTHHLHDYKFIEKNEVIDRSLQSVDQVAGEIVIEQNMLSLGLKYTSYMMMTDTTLDKLLTEEQFKATDECMREYLGIGVAMFNNFKPIFVYQLIMVAKYMQTQEESQPESAPNPMESPMATGNSMDTYFQNRAKELEKEVIGLETVDDQLKVLIGGYSLERQVEMLMEMVDDQEGDSTNELLRLSNLYNQQNLSELLKLMEESTTQDELATLLINRNNSWIPVIDRNLQEGKSTFIAVGAGHLPGTYGVIHLLREKGYTLKPIRIEVE